MHLPINILEGLVSQLHTPNLTLIRILEGLHMRLLIHILSSLVLHLPIHALGDLLLHLPT
jgi:hypothetical protein